MKLWHLLMGVIMGAMAFGDLNHAQMVACWHALMVPVMLFLAFVIGESRGRWTANQERRGGKR
jgi:hypothetical protein